MLLLLLLKANFGIVSVAKLSSHLSSLESSKMNICCHKRRVKDGKGLSSFLTLISKLNKAFILNGKLNFKNDFTAPFKKGTRRIF